MEINVLVCLDENYLPQLRVMLSSLLLNTPAAQFTVYLLHSGIPDGKLASLEHSFASRGHVLHAVRVNSALFEKAPVNRYYSQEMYYRLLAGQLLPKNIHKALYLDPDILIINSVAPLWETDLAGRLFAAAAHTGKSEFATGVNQLRLGTEGAYFNSGVLLMDLDRCREEITPAEIFAYVERHAAELLLPDQDVLNALYSDRILPLEDILWNYDARNFGEYLVSSHGKADISWVMEHTAILHFCGREKPWKKHYHRRFGVLYQHYMRLAEVILPQ